MRVSYKHEVICSVRHVFFSQFRKQRNQPAKIAGVITDIQCLLLHNKTYNAQAQMRKTDDSENDFLVVE